MPYGCVSEVEVESPLLVIYRRLANLLFAALAYAFTEATARNKQSKRGQLIGETLQQALLASGGVFEGEGLKAPELPAAGAAQFPVSNLDTLLSLGRRTLSTALKLLVQAFSQKGLIIIYI